MSFHSHRPLGIAAGLWLAALLVALPLWCAEEATITSASSQWSIFGRYSTSEGLGYDGDGYGVELGHMGHRWGIDLAVTTADKADGGDGYASRLVIERELWRGLSVGVRGVYADLDEWQKSTLGPVVSYVRELGPGMTFRLRGYGPGVSAPHEWGLVARMTGIVGHFAAAIELEHWWFAGGSGPRASVLAGVAW